MLSLAFPVALPVALPRADDASRSEGGAAPAPAAPHNLTEVYRRIDCMLAMWSRTTELGLPAR